LAGRDEGKEVAGGGREASLGSFVEVEIDWHTLCTDNVGRLMLSLLT